MEKNEKFEISQVEKMGQSLFLSIQLEILLIYVVWKPQMN